MSKLFVYGTLMNDEIQVALVGKVFDKSPAQLNGYNVNTLQDRYSPGLTKKSDSVAKGFVLHDVDDISFETIKTWEGDDYTLVEVMPDDGAHGICYTYLWNSEIKDKPWDNKEFRKKHMQWYLSVDIPNFLDKYTALT